MAKRRVDSPETKAGLRMDVVFQVPNEGVAFRCVFPEKSKDMRGVNTEEGRSVSAETKDWLQPMYRAIGRRLFGQFRVYPRVCSQTV